MPADKRKHGRRGVRSWLRALAQNLILAGIMGLLVVVMLEISFRFAAHKILPGGEWLTTAPIFNITDHPIGYSLKPHATRLLTTGVAYTVRDRINSLGYRDRERTLENPEGRPRLLVLGDSFVFGQGVSLDEGFTILLDDRLDSYEVINVGIPGFGLGQEYLLYKDRAHRFNADLVLLGFFINDLELPSSMEIEYDPTGLPLSYQRKEEVLKKRAAEAPRGIRGGVSSWLRAKSMLYSLVRNRLDNLGARPKHRANEKPRREGYPGYLTLYFKDPDEATREKWEKGYRILDAIKEAVTERGARFAVVSIPANWQLTDEAFARWAESYGVDPETLSPTRPDEMLRAWCSRSGTPCLSLLDAFQGRKPLDLYFSYDLHLNAAGHELAAEEIEEFLRDERLLTAQDGNGRVAGAGESSQ